MTDGLRASWLDMRDGVRHAVLMEGEPVERGRWHVTGEHMTDCGIVVPLPAECSTDKPVTCEACLFGGLDGALRAFNEAKEPVGAAAWRRLLAEAGGRA